MKRRQLIQAGMQSWLLGAMGAAGLAYAETPSPRGSSTTLRFGTTPVFLDHLVGFLSRWGSYLTDATGLRVKFVQRRAYRDIMDLLRREEIDVAWICGYPWVVNQSHLKGLALPLYKGEPW